MTALQWASWHGNAEMVRETLRYRPKLELSCQHEITALGSALHGAENSWHRQTGDYGATVEALLDAGAKAPKLSDDLDASQEGRDVLRRYEERSGSAQSSRKRQKNNFVFRFSTRVLARDTVASA